MKADGNKKWILFVLPEKLKIKSELLMSTTYFWKVSEQWDPLLPFSRSSLPTGMDTSKLDRTLSNLAPSRPFQDTRSSLSWILFWLWAGNHAAHFLCMSERWKVSFWGTKIACCHLQSTEITGIRGGKNVAVKINGNGVQGLSI